MTTHSVVDQPSVRVDLSRGMPINAAAPLVRSTSTVGQQSAALTATAVLASVTKPLRGGSVQERR